MAAAAALADGICGQGLDLALLLADGSPTGRVDPAFEADLQHIVHWAQAVRNEWLPTGQLVTMAADAKLEPPLATAMLAAGIALSFLTVPLWTLLL